MVSVTCPIKLSESVSTDLPKASTLPPGTGSMAEAVGGRSSREPFELGVGGGDK